MYRMMAMACSVLYISYQLQNTSVCNADSSELRQKVADHLEANAALYHDFLCQPVLSEDGDYNADTEQPTAEDEYTDSVADLKLQTELSWQKCVRCLRQGGWGDHITLQAIADMLSVKFSVLSSNHPMFSVTPGICSAECEILVGLTLQYHYVALDKVYLFVVPVCNRVLKILRIPQYQMKAYMMQRWKREMSIEGRSVVLQ